MILLSSAVGMTKKREDPSAVGHGNAPSGRNQRCSGTSIPKLPSLYQLEDSFGAPGYLFYSLTTIFVLLLRPGGDDDPFGQPVVGAPLTFFIFGFADAQPVLKLFDQAVLGDGFMEEDRAHLASRREIAAHGMNVGDLFGFPDHGLDLLRKGRKTFRLSKLPTTLQPDGTECTVLRLTGVSGHKPGITEMTPSSTGGKVLSAQQ